MRRDFLGLLFAVLGVAYLTAAARSEPTPNVVQLATFKAGASLQGLDVAKDGSVYVTVNADDALVEVSPAGQVREIARLPIHPHAVLVRRDGFVVTGQTNRFSADASLPPAQRFANLDGRVLVLDLAGRAKRTIEIGAATFPNGLAPLPDGTVLVADSVAGVIWRVNLGSGRVERWSEDPFLKPEPNFPGANGLRVANGWVYASNTAKQEVARVKLTRSLTPLGSFAVLGTVPRVDEVAVAPNGTVFAATHGSMYRIAPDGTVGAVWPEIEGGSTLRLADGRRSIYVTTDGVRADGSRGETRVLRLDLPP